MSEAAKRAVGCDELPKETGPSRGSRWLAALGCLVAACAETAPLARPPSPPEGVGSSEQRAQSEARVVDLRLVTLNDFHGNLLPLTENGRPIGGAETLAAYIRDRRRGRERRSLVVHAGDHVGASPPESGLLKDEPSMLWLSLLGSSECRFGERVLPACDVIGTLGNHEFDEGRKELERLLFGGASPQSFEPNYSGSQVPYVSCNVLDAQAQRTLLPPFIVRHLDGVPVGIIGAVLRETPTVVSPAGVRGLEFLDEVTAINDAARQLVERGVRVIVVTIHQGLVQQPYEGPTRRDVVADGPLRDIVHGLHEEIDVVVSGHTHAFTNLWLPRPAGEEVLVTQAHSAGRAIGVIDLEVDRASGQVLSKTAEVQVTYGDVPPGNVPQPDVAELVAAVHTRVRATTLRVVGFNRVALARSVDEHGESALGNLVADAQRSATGADIALTNLGGIRSDLPAGPVTWGQLYTVQPFENHLVRLELTGKAIRAVLERQWTETGVRFLQISGMTYSWDPTRPWGARVRELREADGTLVAPDKSYTVSVNAYMAAGGDGFLTIDPGEIRDAGQTDLDALVRWFQTRPQVSGAIDRRVRRLQ